MDNTYSIKKAVFIPLVVILNISLVALSGCNNQIPQGFVSSQNTATGTGQILIGRNSQQLDLATLLRESLDQLDKHFDGTLQFKGGVRDNFNNTAQVLFIAKKGTQPIEGIAIARVQGQEGGVWVIYDRPGTLGNSISQESQNTTGIGIDPQSLRWNQIPFPDGSGSVELPDGWKLTQANKGAMIANQPNGALVAFGQAFPINTPNTLMNFPEGYPRQLAYQKSPYLPYLPPEQALIAVNTELSRVGWGPRPTPTIAILERYPTPIANGQASFLHYTAEPIIFNGQRVKGRALAYIITSGENQMTWMYYYSQISAPEPLFSRYFAVMMRIWGSWRVSGKVHQERLNEAIANMREIKDIVDSTTERSIETRNNAHADWIDYIRNEGFIKDTNLNDVSSVRLEDVEQYAANSQGRYQVIRRRDLNR